MAETTLDLRDIAKPQAYDQLQTQLSSVLEEIDDEIAAMATIRNISIPSRRVTTTICPI